MAAAKKEAPRELSELDPKSRERLGEILRKEEAALSNGDREFLKGRRDYLTAEQKKDFGLTK
jgi:hypothetical protein